MPRPALSANNIADGSIKLVQEAPWPSKTSDAPSQEAATTPLRRPPPFPRATTVNDERSVTIATSLEVVSASPSSSTSRIMSSRVPKSEVRSAHAPVRTTQQNVRVSRSAGVLNENLPQTPLSDSLDEPCQPRATRSIELPHHAPEQSFLSSKSKLPEFRQSRRWARFHEAAERRVACQQRAQQKLPLSMREASFEKQRAKPRTSLQSRAPVPAVVAKALSETDSFVEAQGLCRSLSIPAWHVMKSARIPRPYSLPSNWVARKFSFRRYHRTGSKSTERRASVDITASPHRKPLRRRIRPKKAVADLRRKAGFASSINKFVEYEKVVDLDSVSAQLALEKGSGSPVPSLHDPEKAKRFSQECEALLSNADFDKDWQATLERSRAPLSSPLGTCQTQEPFRSSTNRRRPKSKGESAGNSPIPINAPDSPLEARKNPEMTPLSTAPEPPVRTSSKSGARLASVVQLKRPACIPILHGVKSGVLVEFGNAAESSSTIGRANQPLHPETPSRMSSSVSRAEQQSYGPRAKPSTDTLTMIEAQIQDGARAVMAGKLKQNTAFIVGPEKCPITGSGAPPERPLPALPPAEQNVSPTLEDIRGTAEVENPSQAHPAEPSPSRQQNSCQQDVCVSDNASNQNLRSLAAAKDLTIMPITNLMPATEVSPTLPTPSSTHSHTSLASPPPLRLALRFTRHDMSQLRPERIRELKKRLKDDLARERRISEEDESRAESNDPAERPLPLVPSAERRGSIDPLNQFPMVPESRPQSRASVGTNRAHSQSRSRSHARQSSKASAMRPRSVRQTLGTSEIKVLVDSNPVTGRFRAGALSPAPSFAGSSREGSPVKAHQGLSTTSVNVQDLAPEAHDTKKISLKKPSFGSLRSHTGVPGLLRRGSSDQYSDSEDDISSVRSPAKGRSPGTKKLRRRWNSNDMQTVQMLFEDLECYYETIMKQERELRKQREEIQMMVRVFAPISRANGLKAAIFKALQPEAALERERVEAQGILEKEVERLKAARERTSKAKEKEGVGKVRPISQLSSTSATTNATYGSMGTGTEQRASMEGSITDPLEYDLPVPAEAGVACSAAAQAGLNLSGKAKIGDTVSVQRERPGSRGGLTAMMHRPPPVAKVVPKGKMAEEEEDRKLSLSTRSVDAGEGEGKENKRRLNINHVLTSTEQMDRALEDFTSFP